MINSTSCLIDNWSLEASAFLLESEFASENQTGIKNIERIGCLSNLINAIVFLTTRKY